MNAAESRAVRRRLSRSLVVGFVALASLCGVGPLVAQGAPVTTPSWDATSTTVAAGESHSLVTEATGRVWSWGSNEKGQLGDAARTAGALPGAASTATDRRYAAVAAGRDHSLALDEDGRVWAWGANAEGQLGDGTVMDRSEPVAVATPPGVAFRDVSAGWKHSLAIDRQGRAWAWGGNDSGQLGIGSRSNRLAPAMVDMPSGVTFTTGAAGSSHALALDLNGRSWGWGHNRAGQLGDGSNVDRTRPVPTRMPVGATFVALAAGSLHSLAVDGEGRVWAWGSDLAGTIGDGGNERGPPERRSPSRVDLPDAVRFARVAGGQWHSLALDTEGRAWSWGADSRGQLGAGQGSLRIEPGTVRMPPGIAFVEIAAGWDHSLAVDRNGGVWAWGENASGRLGDATTVDRRAPVPVGLPDGVLARGADVPDPREEGDASWDERFLVDWGRFDTAPAPGVPNVTGFEGVTSETGMALTYQPVGASDSWIVDVVVSATPPSGRELADDVALVSVFPVGVVSLAVPEPLRVDYDGIVLEVLDARTGAWIPVEDAYRRPGAEVSLLDWVDGAFLAIDTVSLVVPKLQALKLLLMLPRIVEEYKDAEWDAAFDPERVLPREAAFVDPNAYRVVQVPWRFDGLERYAEEATTGLASAGDRAGPWSELPDQGGVVPVRVRVPLAAASEQAVDAVRAFVVVTEEHTIYAPAPTRSPLTGTTAAPIPLPSRVVAAARDRTSVSRYALRVVGERGLRRVPPSGDAVGPVEIEPRHEVGASERPGDVAAFERFRVGTVSGAWYDSAATFEVEEAGPNASRFMLGLEAEPGTRFSSAATGYTVSFRDGLAYLAVPNVPGLRVGYDEVTLEALNRVTGEWDVVPNAYAGPARSADSVAVSEATNVAWDLVVGETLELLGGQGIGRTMTAIGIVADLASLRFSASDVSADETQLVVPLDPAFYDRNRFRLVEIPWQLPDTVPRGDSGDPDRFLYADPRDPTLGGMRLRIVVPVEGLAPELTGQARGFVSSTERVTAWTTPLIGPPRNQDFRTRVVTAASLAASAPDGSRSDAEGGCLALAAWGRDSHGQTEVPTGLTVRSVRAGLFHVLAITDDGRLAAWGRDDHGQGSIPAELPESEYVAVATGTEDSYALTRDGSLYMWGGSFSGVAVQDASGVVDLRVEQNRRLLLYQDGRVELPGWSRTPEALDRDRGDYVQIDTSRSATLLRSRQGVVSLESLSIPPWVERADDLVSMALGDFGAAALHDDGTVTWWEIYTENGARQGFGRAAVDVAVGRDFVAVLLEDGTVRVIGPDRNRVALVPPVPGVIRELEAGFDYLIALVEKEACP